MKRYLVGLLSILVVLLFVGQVFAVVEGACTQALTAYKTANPNLKVLTFTCLGSDNDGDFPAIAATAAIMAEIKGWYIYEVRTYNGTKAPQDQYDITITDADGFDLMGGTLANRSNAASERALPLWVTGQYKEVPIINTITLNITGTNVTVSTPTIKVFLTK